MIAFHSENNSFTEKWELFFKNNSINYCGINIYSSELISVIKSNDIHGVLFDMNLYDVKTKIASHHVVRSVESVGVKIFPSSSELWHFDDKLAQKYLFESLSIPHCPTWVFYDVESAFAWANATTYPKIFKLRSGAGSANVLMVKSKKQAEFLIRKMFGSGIASVPGLFSDFKTKVDKHRKTRDWNAVLRRLPTTIRDVISMKRNMPRERGYVYFQEYMPNNSFDTRVSIIGNRAFAFRRMVRRDDFRASGSGDIDWDITSIDLNLINIAFKSSELIGAQSMAYDFVYTIDGTPVVIECCYRFNPEAVLRCPGYWDRSLEFHKGNYYPQDLIIKDFLGIL